jgi:hypothetical protein
MIALSRGVGLLRKDLIFSGCFPALRNPSKTNVGKLGG